MMSEEEFEDDSFTQHLPIWRSDILNSMIDEADRQYFQKESKTPSRPRKLGSPLNRPAPADWMMKPEDVDRSDNDYTDDNQ